jgi:hypothetical protein
MKLESAPAAFAVLDILGYGALMRRDPADVLSLVLELLESSRRNAIVQGDVDKFARYSGDALPPTIKYLQFSDTLLIWLPLEPTAPKLFQSPAQLVRTVSYVTSLTLASFISVGIPLRGAVGFGPIFISSEPLFFTGGELYETMKLERQQAWAGAALHESAVRALDLQSFDPFFVKYPVPMTNAEPCTTVAVDWATPLTPSPGLIPPWDAMFGADPSDSKIRTKKEGTQRFFQTLTASYRPFPIRFADQSLLPMRQRLSALLCD